MPHFSIGSKLQKKEKSVIYWFPPKTQLWPLQIPDGSVLPKRQGPSWKLPLARGPGNFGNCCSKCVGPLDQSVSVSWELFRKADFLTPPQTCWIRNSGVGLSSLHEANPPSDAYACPSLRTTGIQERAWHWGPENRVPSPASAIISCVTFLQRSLHIFTYKMEIIPNSQASDGGENGKVPFRSYSHVNITSILLWSCVAQSVSLCL